jgi:Rad3-related DNA helicase
MTTHDEEISLHADEAHQLSETCRSACADYLKYLESILEPALTELEEDDRQRRLTLHQVIGANLCVAHAVDYIQAIRAADGIKEKRTELIAKFDAEFSIDGARIQNGKMTLIDAVNNAMKHVRINPNRYEDLVQKYGQVSFECLVAVEGRILCILDGVRKRS